MWCDIFRQNYLLFCHVVVINNWDDAIDLFTELAVHMIFHSLNCLEDAVAIRARVENVRAAGRKVRCCSRLRLLLIRVRKNTAEKGERQRRRLLLLLRLGWSRLFQAD